MDRTVVKAIDSQDAETLAALLSQNPASVHERVPTEGTHEQTLLHRAIPSDGVPLTDGHIALIQTLLDRGAVVDAPGWGANNGVCTPLTMAAWGGHTSIARLLLARGADPNGAPEQTSGNRRPIDTAAAHGHSETVDLLIANGANFILPHLLQANLLPRIEDFLRQNPNAATQILADGTPPLHLATESSVARLLLSAGADASARDAVGRTALHRALEEELPKLAAFLTEIGSPLDLFAAAGLGDSTTVTQLLETAPHLACEAQRDGTTALFYAVHSGDRLSTERLLFHGAAVSPHAKRFWACLTPLHLALQRQRRDLTLLLLAHGANPNAFADNDEDGYWPTPLHIAARWSTLDDIRLLLDHNADPNGGNCGQTHPGTLGSSALSWATFAGSEPVVRLLLERGLDPLHPNHSGVLHLAAERGHIGIIRLLLQAGANPNTTDTNSETPSACAARFGQYAVHSIFREQAHRQ